MKTAFFSTHNFEKKYLLDANKGKHEIKWIEACLSEQTENLASGCEAISIFVNDDASANILVKLKRQEVNFLALRSTGFNHVNVEKAKELNLKIARVPDYSPYAIAEYTLALILALNRKLIPAHSRIMEQNFTLNGLVGFDIHEKVVGVIGTGKIGSLLIKILHGFGCKILALDPIQNDSLKKQFDITYTDCETLCKECDIITLHAPLTNESKYIINHECISRMKKGVMLINTSRGALLDTKAVIEGLKSGKIGYFGMDVYEEEKGLFFEDHSEDILMDDTIARLMTFRNVIITGHQAFLTDTALMNIANTTIYNLDCFEKGILSGNELY